MPFPHAEGRHDEPRRLHHPDHLFEHRRPISKQRPAVAGNDFDRVQQFDIAPRHHAAEIGGLAGVDRILMGHMERIALLPHVQAGERAPGPADRIKRPLLAAHQDRRSGKRLGDELLGLLDRALRRLFQPQPAQREGLSRADGVVADVDDLEAAAAKVAGDAVGLVNAGNHAERRQPRLLPAGKHLDAGADDALHRGDEFRAVGRLARRRRRQHVDIGDPHLHAKRAEPPHRRQRRGDRRRIETAGRLKAASEAAQLLLVEKRRRRAGQPLVDDQPYRVRPDVDHRDRARAVQPAGRLLVFHLTPVSGGFGAAWANRS